MSILRLIGRIIGCLAKLIGYVVILIIAFIFTTDFLYSSCAKSLKKCNDKNPSMICSMCKKASTRIKYDINYSWSSRDDSKKD